MLSEDNRKQRAECPSLPALWKEKTGEKQTARRKATPRAKKAILRREHQHSIPSKMQEKKVASPLMTPPHGPAASQLHPLSLSSRQIDR